MELPWQPRLDGKTRRPRVPEAPLAARNQAPFSTEARCDSRSRPSLGSQAEPIARSSLRNELRPGPAPPTTERQSQNPASLKNLTCPVPSLTEHTNVRVALNSVDTESCLKSQAVVICNALFSKTAPGESLHKHALQMLVLLA